MEGSLKAQGKTNNKFLKLRTPIINKKQVELENKREKLPIMRQINNKVKLRMNLSL